MRRRLRPQRGASLGIVLIVIVLVVFFGNLAVNMIPAYMTFMQVRASMASLHAKEDVIAGGPRKIMNALSSQLYINDVRTIDPKSFKIRRAKDGLELTADYEVQKHVFMNVDVVMHFVYSETYEKP
ncbi:MAG: DUF4845 domain-containing protein [Thiohalocapsa sp.]